MKDYTQMALDINDGWSEYRQLLIDTIDERFTTLHDDISELRSDIKELSKSKDEVHTRIETKVAALDTRVSKNELRAGAWGATAGAIPVAIAILLKFFGK